MMTGLVNADLEPRLLLTVRAASGQRHEVEAVIDTGFNDFLTLPPALILGRHALYPRHVKGQKQVSDEHRPSRNAREQEDALRERFAELGESALAFLEGLFRSHRQRSSRVCRPGRL
jgi:hypothetical protein